MAHELRRRTLLATTLATPFATPMLGAIMSDPAAAQPTPSPDDTVYMDLKEGRVTIQLLPEIAPKHVERVRILCHRHFYDGTVFHRVIEGFMAQGGDPTGTGTGGSDLPDLPAEFTRQRHFLRGTVGAARTANPNSANSQFFIMFAPAPNLDGQYTIWGQVISGMDYVDAIKRGGGANGLVSQPDHIVKMRVASDQS
jgi:peptidylprolyl isomerase